MRIGVISDTHVKTVDELPAKILKNLTGVDLIVHAGDFTDKAVLDGLKTIGAVKAVAGNMDSGELQKELPQKELFVFDGKKIGLIHGSGGPRGIAVRVRELFDDADIIIYGHSHEACNRYIKGSLMFNPGQARDSFGILTPGDEVKAEIISV